jgi:branched-chain amino acid transport system substrate-binding protein
MTGDAAVEGTQQNNGVDIAVKEINSKGGINGKMLEYDVFDDQGIPNQAVICAEKIAADSSYRFVISSIFSGCTMAAQPVLDEAGLAMIAGSNTSDRITGLGWENYVRVIGPDSGQLKQILDFAITTLKSEKPAIIYTSAEIDIHANEQAVKYLKEKHGREFFASVQIEAFTEKDFTAHITNLKNSGTDCVFFSGEYTQGGLFLKQKKSFNWDVPVLTRSGCATAQFIEIAGADAAEGAYSIAPFFPTNPKPSIQKFVGDYSTLYGATSAAALNEWAVGAYDCVYLMAQALSDSNAGKLSGKALIDWMKTNSKREGLLTMVNGFAESGDNPNASEVLLQVRNGQFVAY